MNLFNKVGRSLEVAAGILLGLCVFAVFINAMLRFLLDSGIMVTEELSRIALVWIVFLGAIAALHAGQHLGMDTVIRKLKPQVQLPAALVAGVLMLVCDVMLVVGSWKQAELGFADKYPVSGLPISVLFLPGVIAGLFFMAITGRRLVLVLKGQIPPMEILSSTAEDADVVESRGARP